jgi:hypothetical protein
LLNLAAQWAWVLQLGLEPGSTPGAKLARCLSTLQSPNLDALGHYCRTPLLENGDTTGLPAWART